MDSNRASLCKNFRSLREDLGQKFWDDSSEDKTKFYETITSEYIHHHFPDSFVSIVFGSAANGSSRSGSDVDLIIIGSYGKRAVKICQTFQGLLFDVQIFDIQVIKQYLMLCGGDSNNSILIPYAIVNGKSTYSNSSYFEELLELAKKCIERQRIGVVEKLSNEDIRVYSGIINALMDMSDVKADWSIRVGALWRVVGFVSSYVLNQHGIESETYGSLKVLKTLEPQTYELVNRGIREYIELGQASTLIELSAQHMFGPHVDSILNYELDLFSRSLRLLRTY